MKTVSFISRRRIMTQGLEAAIAARPLLGLKILPMIPPQNVCTDIQVYGPDLIMIDVTADMQQETLFALCRQLRGSLAGSRLFLLIAEDNAYYRNLSVRAKQSGLADDFVFYDNSMDYLLAKLSAL